MNNASGAMLMDESDKVLNKPGITHFSSLCQVRSLSLKIGFKRQSSHAASDKLRKDSLLRRRFQVQRLTSHL